MKKNRETEELIAGVDYKVISGGKGWIAFPDTESTQQFRHTWILVRRIRPRTPSFAFSPLPNRGKGEDHRSATIVMSYFHPWTLRERDADEHVPFAGQLRKANDTWQEALRTWLDGQVLCEEARRYVANFLSVHRVRHSDDDSEPENSDDLISDEDLILSSSALDEALDTRIGGVLPGQMLKTRT